MTDTDTITIPRDLFERLCDAAIYIEKGERWAVEHDCEEWTREYRKWEMLKNEAVAMRDGGKQ